METSSQPTSDGNGFFALATAPFKRYFEFSGRSRRKEYFYFHIFILILSVVVGIWAGITGANAELLGNIVELCVLIPSIAVGVRRMHDTNHNGWWIVVPIANLIFLFLGGDSGPNRYGDDPKQ